MKTNIKSILSVIAGVIVAVISIASLEMIPIGPHIPVEVQNDPVQLEHFMSQLPMYLYGWITLCYAIGSFVGGITTSLFIGGNQRLTIRLSSILMAFGILNLLTIPQPWWFWFHLIVYFPATWLGLWFSKRFFLKSNAQEETFKSI